jgi:hypothetical protein
MSAPARRKRLAKVLEDAGTRAGLCGQLRPWASRAGRCWRRWWLGRPIPRSWPNWPAGSSASRLPALREALEGRFGSHHALLVGEMLARIDQLDESIERLSVEVARVLVLFSPLAGVAVNHPGRGSAHRRGGPGRDRPGHGPLSLIGASGQLGRGLSGQPRVGRQAPARAGPARAPSGCGPRWSRRPTPPPAPRTPTWPRTTSAAKAAGGTTRPSSRSPTPSW